MTHTLTTDALVQYKGHYYTGADIKAMREWISDCQWGDLDQDEIADLSNVQVLRGIDCNVDGGLSEFVHNMI